MSYYTGGIGHVAFFIPKPFITVVHSAPIKYLNDEQAFGDLCIYVLSFQFPSASRDATFASIWKILDGLIIYYYIE